MDGIEGVPTSAVTVNGDTTANGEVQGSTDWRSGINPEFANNQSLQEYKDINGLAKSHIELQKMMGSSIRIPAENASPEHVD